MAVLTQTVPGFIRLDNNKKKGSFIMEKDNDYSLAQENLVPFYLVEDKLKSNFNNISSFITHQQIHNAQTDASLEAIRTENKTYQIELNQKLVSLQKKIVQQISQELEGRIVLAVNKSMASFAGRMQEKQEQIAQFSQGITAKLDSMKKNILYEGAKDAQKAISKEVEKLEKKMKTEVQNAGDKEGRTLRATSRKQAQRNVREPTAPENYFTEEWVLRIKELESKAEKVEEFLVGFDKRYYDNVTSLKESWKQLGEDMMATKKKLASKQDELRLDLVRIKGIRQFQGGPEEVEESFKKMLMDKFTDIYQLFGQLVPKADFEGETQRMKKILSRHNEELSDVREEMAKNSDYFTFYVNNSDRDDLSAKIKVLQREASKLVEVGNERAKEAEKGRAEIQKEIEGINGGLRECREVQGKIEEGMGRLRETILKEEERIQALEEHNNFTPQKMAKIHNMLDIDFSPPEEQLIAKKQSDFGQSQALKQLRIQIGKVKDELFVVSHQLAEVEKMKKSMAGLEGRVDKIKVESEEAVLSRKPWVCLSCDRNEKDKQDQERVKREASRKKLQDAKALFSKDKSEKLIKLIPSSQEKFEVYEKYRQKYLSENVRLPDIYREKIGDKEPFLN